MPKQFSAVGYLDTSLIISNNYYWVMAWISAASLPKWLDFEKQQPMQTFYPRHLTFLTWRSIYLNIKEASRPIALRFGDSHIENFQPPSCMLTRRKLLPDWKHGIFYLWQGLLTSWCADAKTKWWICGHEKFTNVAFIRPWINYTDYICYSFHSLSENNMAHVTVDWNPLGKVFYR